MATNVSPAMQAPAKRAAAYEDMVFGLVRNALKDLQFGTVTIVVQNGRVVQIERHEKTRIGQPEVP